MKKQTMKKVLAFALAAVMVLGVLTACGKTPGTGDSQDPVVIDFWHHYSAQSAENETLMNVLIPKFEEEIQCSFLSDELKTAYIELLHKRLMV